MNQNMKLIAGKMKLQLLSITGKHFIEIKIYL